MAKARRHLQFLIPVGELVTELNKLTNDDDEPWILETCTPADANMAQLGDNARMFCLLSRDEDI